MTASKFSTADLNELWRASLQSGLLGRVDETELSAHLGVSIQRARNIVKDLISIGFYDPRTRRMDASKLPKQQWSAPMTGEELDARIKQLSALARQK